MKKIFTQKVLAPTDNFTAKKMLKEYRMEYPDRKVIKIKLGRRDPLGYKIWYRYKKIRKKRSG